MISKIPSSCAEKPAYVYISQATMGQVGNDPETAQRQCALRDKALELGWRPSAIRILDQDLRRSGSQNARRRDFEGLLADVSLQKVGAVFSLEASTPTRSFTDWYRLVELCSQTGTLIIDKDGCYDPADLNDRLILGLKRMSATNHCRRRTARRSFRKG